MLDSSPVALPPVPRPLKRSASTASLPTPPRTHHKRSRGRSRGSCDSDTETDSDNASTSDDEELRGGGHKKRRTSEAKEDEEAFWLGQGPSRSKTTGSYTASSSTVKTRTDSPPAAALLYRRRQQTDVAPVSPPPSHRKQPAVASSVTMGSMTPSPDSSPVTAALPSTPKGKRALLDSPNNPFIVSPADTPDSSSPSGQSASPHTPTPYQEKPTITYVFRGVRRSYANPLYNQAEDRPVSPPPNSLLPIEHPDYTPDPSCRPKLLFPAARRQNRHATATGKRDTSTKHHARGAKGHSRRSRSLSVSSNEDSDAESDGREGAAVGLIRPKKLDFAAASARRKKTWDQERNDALLKAGERVSR